MRRAVVCLALGACQPAPAAPAPVPPDPSPVAQEPPASPPAGSELSDDAPPAGPDIEVAAAHEGVVFMRAQGQCEVWQFIDGGERIETVADERLGLRLSFLVEVRDPTTVTLTDPKAASRGATTDLECPGGSGGSEILFVEEDDCEEVRHGIEIERGCPASLLEPEHRSAALHRLEAGRREVLAKRLEEAAKRVAAFDAAIRRSKAVFWNVGDDTKTTCEKWSWRRAKRRGDDDVIVRSDRGGGTTLYGMYASYDERSGAASVNLMGPHSEGPGGSGSSIMHWDVQSLSAVTDKYAVVGGKRWYFSAAACRADKAP